MASVVPENWPLLIANEHNISPLEAMETDDNALVISLLQDSQLEDCDDDERLLSVIQSLKAEIDPNVMMNDHDHNISSLAPNLEDCQPSDMLPMKDRHCSILSDDHMDSISWINDEEMVISSPVEDGMNMWCMDMICDYYEFDNRVEFEEIGNYFYQNNQQVFDFEEPAGQNTSLWQETYEPVFYS